MDGLGVSLVEHAGHAGIGLWRMDLGGGWFIVVVVMGPKVGLTAIPSVPRATNSRHKIYYTT